MTTSWQQGCHNRASHRSISKRPSPATMTRSRLRSTRNYGRLDGLLHNAGHPRPAQPHRALRRADLGARDARQRHRRVRAHAGVPAVAARSRVTARCVFTSSSVGRQGRALWGAYAVSKFAVEGLAQVLADELQPAGMRVNCINPAAHAPRCDCRRIRRKIAACFPSRAHSWVPIFICWVPRAAASPGKPSTASESTPGVGAPTRLEALATARFALACCATVRRAALPCVCPPVSPRVRVPRCMRASNSGSSRPALA